MDYTGNVDTEMGGMGQSFGALSGNVNTEGLSRPLMNNGMTERGSADFDAYFKDVEHQLKIQREGSNQMEYYKRLGTQLMSVMQGPQNQGGGQQVGNITQGFNQNWLMEQTNAGSANGQKI